ncbi:DUF2087 domain-containing protein [Niveispirillum cyanobacteriorum]|uniref:Uncharacterized protein n=1 Tax=Niveispirillum cyanobacteriorum TaxID=1612173 RepID=A0A2K9NE89_9PROT|nr:DUF2087 domain-containing protein [Niveispirillum cyanobacteriorum]AUN30495.1 hypothetical protein C0V82_09795 [Niveispirillum cyanobacteriorum]GGE54050.1 hypothetical protein GCM10011317_10340 [Niveispirillum cyanobacteriorum]
MSKQELPFQVADIGALAKSLKSQLEAHEGRAGHVQLLNMLARGAGYRNFQHYRAQAAALDQLENPAPAAPTVAVDHARVRRLMRHFDDAGQLIRWPNKFNEQATCLWVIWSRLPPRDSMTEQQISRKLNEMHSFRDFALLRRELVEQGLVSRTPDCRDYRRIERGPPPDALALIRYLAQRKPQ